MSAKANKETLGFQTEVKQLLHLVVHSLYSNKEIFLRELVSNSSDALDKLRFLALSDASLYEEDSNLAIKVNIDKDANTIRISDNGIGMSREEVIASLGTIAKSGTKEFLSQLSGDEAKDSHLIGQFGVGFYSAFIIADKVTVKTRRAGLAKEEAVVWSSTGEGDYTIESTEKPSRGTEVILHLKEGEDEFLNDWRLRNIITKYSDHICWPIEMHKLPSMDEESDKENIQTEEYETVNKATALWTLSKSEIDDEEYKELYKHISHDFESPLVWAHNHVEGKQDYISLLYVPSHAPYDLWNQDVKHGLKLYVKRVFIMDDAAQFLPRYLRFVKGVIDSDDLPLNVSREILQDNKQVDSIRAASVKRILGMLEKLARDDAEKYQKFWSEFGLVLKEGPIEDFSNKEKVAKLLRFSTTHESNVRQTVSLDDYLSRMDDKQDKIYYITANSFNAAKNSPHLEVFRKKGIEVLLLSDRIDEWLVSHLSSYEGKSLVSVTKGALDLEVDDTEEEKQEHEKNQQEWSSLLKQIQSVLSEKIKEVRLTNRLTASPACVVSDENDMGREMQRILESAGQEVPESKPIFELNPKHKLVEKLNQLTDDDEVSEWVNMLYEQAILAEGGQLDDPALFVQRVNRLLSNQS